MLIMVLPSCWYSPSLWFRLFSIPILIFFFLLVQVHWRLSSGDWSVQSLLLISYLHFTVIFPYIVILSFIETLLLLLLDSLFGLRTSFCNFNFHTVSLVLSLAIVAEGDDYLARMHASLDRMEQMLVAFTKSHGLPIPTFPVRPSASGSNSVVKKGKVVTSKKNKK